MATVAYLLGAGASAQCIPVVNGMEKDILELASHVGAFYTYYDGETGDYMVRQKDNLDFIVPLLQQLSYVCKTHYSIDTYAKKLFITDKTKFKRLKLDLSLYFTLRQMVNPPDKRYDNFFSSILSAGKKLPSKIKIISWNYDFQVEKSYLEFDIDSDIKKARKFLGLKSPKDWKSQSAYAHKFNFIKLNGSAITKTGDNVGYLFEDLIEGDTSDIEKVIEKYISVVASDKEYECELKFAWESENYEALFSSAGPDLKSVDVLVVIGYSFPFFNREVDIELFNNMPSLRKVYVQDINPENIIETMEEFVNLNLPIKGRIEVIPKRNVDQFVFPKELEVTERTLKTL